jgi:hypothetical protein
MKNRGILSQGLQAACGLFLANAIALPLLGEMEFGRGLRAGLIGAVLVFLVYVGMALLRPERSRAGTKST